MPRKDLRALAQNFHQTPAAVAEGDDVDLDAELARRMAAAGDDSPTPPADPPKRRSKPKPKEKAAPSEPPAAAAVMKKATVHLPVDQIVELRAWKTEHRRSTADVILSAYLEFGDAVRARFGPSEVDQRRIALGLAPLATAQQRDEGPRSQVGLYIKDTALEELDALADELSLSRSQLVSELLTDTFARH